MLTSVTGNVVGIENKTVSNAIHNSAMPFTTQPTVFPIVHLAPLTSFRQWNMEMAIGIPYDTAREITPTETNARKADDEPRLMRPSSICTAVVSTSDQMGVPWRVSTLDQRRETGMALSRAKAQVQRDAATVMEMEQKSVMTSTRKVSPRPPPGEPITTPKMYGRAWAIGASRMSSRGGKVAQMGLHVHCCQALSGLATFQRTECDRLT